MNRIEGMKAEFENAKLVYLTTFTEKGERRSRAMTNFNKDPYDVIWFPTFRDTNKVEDIKKNPRAVVTFPSSREGEFYEVEGRAEFGNDKTVQEKWKWWYLSWLPDGEHHIRLTTDAPITNRVIILVHPETARLVKQS